jgi:DNA-binding transcriptional LysR family regulator
LNLTTADWSRLEVFRAVADAGTITGAAEALAVSPAKVSRDVEELERSLGQALFNRSTRGVDLTEAGQLVLRSVKSMATSAKAISTTIADLTSTQRPQVTIAAHEALATYWLAPRLAEFHRANPQISVNIRVVQDTPDVAQGDADIAIQYDPPSSPTTVSRQLGWLHYVLYASDAYLNVHGIPADRFDLGRHRVLHLVTYQKQREAWAAKTTAWQEIMPCSLYTNSSTVIVETCAADGGIAAMPTYMASVDRRFRPLPHLGSLASVRFWLAYSERLRDLPHSKPVLDWLRACFDPAAHPCFQETYLPPDTPKALRA